MKIRADFVCRRAETGTAKGAGKEAETGTAAGTGTGEYLWCGFSVTGHDAAGSSGFSVLCAAVSSAVQLTCNTLTECFGVPAEAVQVTPAKGTQNQIALRLPSPDPVQSEIVRGLAIHLQLLAEEYKKGLAVTVSQEESPLSSQKTEVQ